MDPYKQEVKKKLDELYYRNEEMKKDLISLHNLLQKGNFFLDTSKQIPPQPVYHPPIQQPVVPPQPVYQPPVQEPVVPPQPVLQPVAPPQPVEQPVQQPKVIEDKKPQPVLQPVQKPVATPSYVPPIPPTPVTPPPPRVPIPPRKPEPSFSERHPDLEKLIGERLLTFIGIIVLVIGIAFFVKYAIDQNWINETGRTAIGILCGGVLLGFAHRLRKNFSAFSSVLVGGGMAVLYFTISYAFHEYHLFSQTVAFLLLVVITMFTILLSLSYDKKELAVFAILGGFGSPLMIATGTGNLPVLSTYMLILDVGMLVLAFYKKWNIVNILSYIFTIMLFAGALTKEVHDAAHPQYVTGLVFATLFYLTFFLMNVINNVRLKNNFSAFEIIALLSNTFLYYGCGYFILKEMDAQIYQGLFTLLVAAFNCLFAFILVRRQEVDRTLFYFLVGLVITFVSLAGPVQLNGNHITLFWAAEGALLLFLSQKSKINLIRYFSVIVTCIAMLGLFYNWITVYFDFPMDKPIIDIMSNKGFITGIVVAASLIISSLLLKNEKSDDVIPGWRKVGYQQFLNVFTVLILFLTGFFELHYQLMVRHTVDFANVIYLTGYSGLFILALYAIIKPLKLDYLSLPVGMLGGIMMVIFGFIPHLATIEARNSFLLDGIGKNAFQFHYIHSLVVIAFAFLLHYQLNKGDKFEKQIKDMYLWLMCFTLVFIASAELDHSYIMAGFTSGLDRGVGMENIQLLASQSHKIGFPILWGISSFIMIVIGMRKKIQQLRIIALVLFAVTIGKLILLGIYGESQAGKIIAFIISGVILLLVSFLYQKLKRLVLEQDQPKENKIEDEKIN